MTVRTRQNLAPWLVKAIELAKRSIGQADKKGIAEKVLDASKYLVGRKGIDETNSDNQRLDVSNDGKVQSVGNRLRTMSSPIAAREGLPATIKTSQRSASTAASYIKESSSYKPILKMPTKQTARSVDEPSKSRRRSDAEEIGLLVASAKSDSARSIARRGPQLSAMKNLYAATRPVKRLEEPAFCGVGIMTVPKPYAIRNSPHYPRSLDMVSQQERMSEFHSSRFADIGSQRKDVDGASLIQPKLRSARSLTASISRHRMPYAPSGFGLARGVGARAAITEDGVAIAVGGGSNLEELSNARIGASDLAGFAASGATAREGDVFLDGTLVGRWMERTLTKSVTRQPVGGSTFDPTRGRLPVGAMVGL